MNLNSYFADLLESIRQTAAQKQAIQQAHMTLQAKLLNDDSLKPLIVSIFLQGSYRRSTATRPQGNEKSDVDVVVVTRLQRRNYPIPDKAMDVFAPFLNRHYQGQWKKKGRSIGIELSNLKLDLVITSDPSEEAMFASSPETALSSPLVQSYHTPDDMPSQTDMRLALSDFIGRTGQWQQQPLYIPDREARQWQRTHPLEQIRWTFEKNALCNGHYVNIVKLIKWWWKTQHPQFKRPKGYPLEHMIGDCCPNGIMIIAAGLTETLEEISRRYQPDVATGRVPCLSDRGVPEHNVLKRLSFQEFFAFYAKIQESAGIARAALNATNLAESASYWQKLFGDRFPSPPTGATPDPSPGFTPRQAPTQIGGGRFA